MSRRRSCRRTSTSNNHPGILLHGKSVHVGLPRIFDQSRLFSSRRQPQTAVPRVERTCFLRKEQRTSCCRTSEDKTLRTFKGSQGDNKSENTRLRKKVRTTCRRSSNVVDDRYTIHTPEDEDVGVPQASSPRLRPFSSSARQCADSIHRRKFGVEEGGEAYWEKETLRERQGRTFLS